MSYRFLRPLLFASDAETAHERMIRFGSALAHSPLAGLIARRYEREDAALATSLWGFEFRSPIGLAAGFDKNARLVDLLPSLGFGFLEIGTVTPLPQAGNPRPRLFRVPQDEAIVNRMGFNNDGAIAVAERLRNRKTRVPVGANIGKNKATPNGSAVQDYERGFEAFADSADYLVVNVSSPNTPNLRELQEKDALRALLARLTELNRGRERKVPLLLKIAPDLSDAALEDIAAIARELSLDGVIATNTTVSRAALKTSADEIGRIGAGGLSGRPLRARATEVISFLYSRLSGIPIVGVGGIASGADAYEKIRAGASLVQLWTALIYEGPGLVARINRELASLLRRDGLSNIREAVGAAHNP